MKFYQLIFLLIPLIIFQSLCMDIVRPIPLKYTYSSGWGINYYLCQTNQDIELQQKLTEHLHGKCVKQTLSATEKLSNVLKLYNNPNTQEKNREYLPNLGKQYAQEISMSDIIPDSLANSLCSICEKKSPKEFAGLVDTLKTQNCYSRPNLIPFIFELITIFFSKNPQSKESLQTLPNFIDSNLITDGFIEIILLQELIKMLGTRALTAFNTLKLMEEANSIRSKQEYYEIFKLNWVNSFIQEPISNNVQYDFSCDVQ